MTNLDTNRKTNSVKLTVFGMSQSESDTALKSCLEPLEGIQSAKLDTKRNIAFVQWAKDAKLTKNDILSAIFSRGYAAEELN